MTEYVIGVDIGTGSTKAVALTLKRKVIAVSQVYYNTDSPKAGYAEQDPEIIWKAFVNCITEVITKIKALPDTVSISSAMHSLLIVNDKNKSITPLITWEDTRSEKIAAALRKSATGKAIYEATGTPIHSMSPLCKIKWLGNNDKKIFNEAAKFISIKEFIWFRLFGKYEIDYSIASSTGLFNIKTLKWNTNSLKFCNIMRSQLSEPVTTDFIRSGMSSDIASTLHLDTSTKFCIGASDGCLANLGSNAVEHNSVALTIGTSGAVRIASSVPISNYSAMIFNYILDGTTFISGGPVNNGGNVLKWMFKTFAKNSSPTSDDYKAVFNEIKKIPSGSDGLIFLPYLYGERAPIWDERASGAFFGMRSLHTNAHFFRAALEGVCFALNNILEILEASTKTIEQLNVSGGFVQSKIWMQILADITGKKVCLVQTQDASAIGAALMGMKALKIIADYDSTKENNYTSINPDRHNAELYKKQDNVYKNLYSLLKPAMHELYQIDN